jgi:hypothetical protein
MCGRNSEHTLALKTDRSVLAWAYDAAEKGWATR